MVSRLRGRSRVSFAWGSGLKLLEAVELGEGAIPSLNTAYGKQQGFRVGSPWFLSSRCRRRSCRHGSSRCAGRPDFETGADVTPQPTPTPGADKIAFGSVFYK